LTPPIARGTVTGGAERPALGMGEITDIALERRGWPCCAERAIHGSLEFGVVG
jgi:hypothetical protein